MAMSLLALESAKLSPKLIHLNLTLLFSGQNCTYIFKKIVHIFYEIEMYVSVVREYREYSGF